MKIWKVYEAATAQERFYKTKKKANDYIKEYYKENEPDHNITLKQFINVQGLDIEEVEVE
jgi:hypothetical protein